MYLEVTHKDGTAEVYSDVQELNLTQWADLLGASAGAVKKALEQSGAQFPAPQTVLHKGEKPTPITKPLYYFPGVIAVLGAARRAYLAQTPEPNQYHPTRHFDWTINVDTSGEFDTPPNRQGTRYRWTSTHPVASQV